MSESSYSALNSIVQLWGSWMWNMSWQLTILVAALLVLDRLLKHTSARLRHMLWLLVLARLLVPPDFAAPTGIAWWLGDWALALNATFTARLDHLLPAQVLTASFANGELLNTGQHGSAAVSSHLSTGEAETATAFSQR
jgi:hypothetical protein